LNTDIEANLKVVQERIARACLRANRLPSEITLIAITKSVAPEFIEQSFRLGIRDFGENRVQETKNKSSFYGQLQPHPTLHMIGHLQSNKIKTALRLFDMIHSVDTLKLAQAIDRQADRKIPVLLEVNIAGEFSKSGFPLTEIGHAAKTISDLKNLDLRGLMTVAPFTNNPEEIRSVFRKLRELKEIYNLRHLSMGMTEDFEIAIEEGSTMIRIGRALFGARQ
jgi:pyridoxal phosphate enzyme (YggS family)